MHLILCIDERDCLHFCGKRLSADAALTDFILHYVKDSKLWMNAYSARLFAADHICIHEDFLHEAGEDDYCFLENVQPATNAQVKSILLCHWNRRYPSTEKFQRSMLDGMRLESVVNFPGNSHALITAERYIL